MAAEVISSFDLPSYQHYDAITYPKDVVTSRRRPPYPSRQERHTRALWHALTENTDSNPLLVLLESGISPNLKLLDTDMKATTALHTAVRKSDASLTSMLLFHGADYDIIDGYSSTPLEIACKKRDFRCVKLLINAGASLISPGVRISCLGLTFYHLNCMTLQDTNVTPSTLACQHNDLLDGANSTLSVSQPEVSLSEVTSLATALLDSGFKRGWNGINCSFAYLNRLYNRDQYVFLLLLQATDDCLDLSFLQSCFSVLYRRHDGETLLRLHRYGYSQLAIGLMQTHRHVESRRCRLELLASPCPLMGLCRVKIRQTLRQKPGKISQMLSDINSIPKCIRKFLDFIEKN